MMDRFTMYPIAFITTIQPWLAAWVLSISFFLTMLFVALMSRGRTFKQVVALALVGYAAMTIVVGLGTSFFMGLKMVTVEVVSVSPRSLIDDD